jgi:hypothetical protein
MWTTLETFTAEIKALLKKLDNIQKEPPSPDSDAREEMCIREEQLWKQKSREQWLTTRDLNTKYFHASTAIRRMYNSITSLKLENGSFLHNRKNIGDEFVKFYNDLFSSSIPNMDDDLVSLFSPTITDFENASPCKIPDVLEITSTISSLGLNKAPGPNGFTGLFYKTYWHIIGKNVIGFVQNFFRNGFLLKEFNHSHIALIPKVDNPSKVNQFCPISLANFNYKIISKILATRLKPFLDRIVSPNQSAFIKGRSIHDNSILAHEIFHSMKKQKRQWRSYGYQTGHGKGF